MRRSIKGALAASIALTALVSTGAIGATGVGQPSAVAVAAVPEPADLSATYNDSTDEDFRVGLQMRLAWTGDYRGRFDGRIGPGSLRAIRDFQARNGLSADGMMDEAFLDALLAASDRAVATVGFAWTDDAETGVRLGLPMALVSPVGRTEVGSMWRAADGSVEIETVRFLEPGYDLNAVFEILSQETTTKTVRTADFLGDHFVLTGVEDGRDFYIRFDGEGSDLRGFSVVNTPELGPAMAPYIAVASNAFEPYAVPAAGTDGPMASLSPESEIALIANEAETLTARSMPSLGAPTADDEFDASGSGFVVSADGWLLTNAHVTNSCKSVLVGNYGVATDIRVDQENDLALLKIDAAFEAPLAILNEKPRLGEDVLALGYPLRSILADSLNVTRGNISSLLGLANDPAYLQISAAVQPGNSGGPVIDLAGRVVGVVTAKLNAVAVADLTGDIPQSINFAIRPDAAASFLEANGVGYVRADVSKPLESVPDATAKVQHSVLPILCLGGPMKPANAKIENMG